jgi:hypothetical protein
LRLEETAAVLFGLAVIVAFGTFFATAYWDALVTPAIELTGAAVFAARYPITLGAALVATAALVRHLRRL